MSYLRSYTVYNGGDLQTRKVYTCDVTGEEIDESHPKYTINGVHISNDGMYKLLEDFIINGCHSGLAPYIMAELVDRYHKQKRFNRYIRPDVKKKVLTKYRHTCVKCGSKDNLTIDHIIPLVNGGKNAYPNLQVLCKPCNSRKGKKSNTEFLSK